MATAFTKQSMGKAVAMLGSVLQRKRCRQNPSSFLKTLPIHGVYTPVFSDDVSFTFCL